jgi:hypothetical protein
MLKKNNNKRGRFSGVTDFNKPVVPVKSVGMLIEISVERYFSPPQP